MLKIDLNCDLGESFGSFKVGQDEKVLDLITSANIACGYHAGDHNVMARTVELCVEKNVAIGAHPGFNDLFGFGRRNIQASPNDIYNSVVYQVHALSGFCKIKGGKMQHVKPHGALFNMASVNKQLAEAIAEAVYDTDPTLILFGLSGSELIRAGEKLGLTVANEVFADRTYLPDGTLTPRTEPNALIKDVDEACERVVTTVKEGVTTAVDGTIIPLQADTICVHGDEPSALLFVQKLRLALLDERILIQKVGDVF